MNQHAELIARLLHRNENGSLAEITEDDQQAAADAMSRLTALEAELAALKAEKAERENQDYAAYVNDDGFIVERDLSIAPGQKLYLAPGAGSVPMTDKEIVGAWVRIADPVALGGALPGGDAVREFVRSIEAHHKIGVKP